ncbi:TlpA family protein disulfide reductase [Haloimpatiens sp. FM7315]|uniref:TlpA family protein disulfide reductase n=1 Tax=Haloimpatiens sp. FM7315 TaxID=3298609 RepID=UPI0035A394CD
MMKEKYLAIIIATIISISVFGCSKPQKSDTTSESKQDQIISQDLIDTKREFSEYGISYYEPKAWKEKNNARVAAVSTGKYKESYILIEIPYEFSPVQFTKELEKEAKNDNTKEDQTKIIEKYQSKAKEFFTIIVFDKSKEKDATKEQLSSRERKFKKYSHKEKISEKGNLECYVLYNEKADESGLTDSEKQEFKEVLEGISSLKKSIKLFDPISKKEEVSYSSKIEFKTKTLNGEDIESGVFKDYKLTMVNIWATFCGPCVKEMPELQELYKDLKKENVNILGIIADTPNAENEDLAKEIVEKKGVKYKNIIPDEKLQKGILKTVTGVPTTVFVDDEGKVVGKTIVGSRSKEDYKKAILDLIAEKNSYK